MIAQEDGGEPRDQVLIAALAAGATQGEAGRIAGVSERTVRRRVADPSFAARLAQAQDQAAGQIAAQLSGMAPKAVETLIALVAEDMPPLVRLRAATVILGSAKTWREATVIEDRLRHLEEWMSTDEGQPGSGGQS